MAAKKGWTRDNAISLGATAVALIALCTSIWDGCENRDYLRRSNEPQMIVSFFHNEGGSGYLIGNAGLGPARIGWLRAFVDDIEVFSWLEVGRALGLKSNPAFQHVNPALTYKPGPLSKLFWVKPGPLDQELQANRRRIQLRICFCSLFDECWIEESRTKEPKQVESCKPFPERPFFQG